jgi:hypothetical protein
MNLTTPLHLMPWVRMRAGTNFTLSSWREEKIMHSDEVNVFLGAFAKLRKAIIGDHVCQSVRME